MKKMVKIDPNYSIMKIADHIPISVVKGPVWNFLGSDEQCWYGKSTDNQATGVIEGSYLDYLVEELIPQTNINF